MMHLLARHVLVAQLRKGIFKTWRRGAKELINKFSAKIPSLETQTGILGW